MYFELTGNAGGKPTPDRMIRETCTAVQTARYRSDARRNTAYHEHRWRFEWRMKIEGVRTTWRKDDESGIDMPFDKEKFASHLQANPLPGFGAGKCAQYVRQALVAAGLNTTGNPLSAKDYGPFVVRLGFASVTISGPYVPLKGDIVVMPANPASVHGHIAGYTGTNWISDFVQNDMYGGPSFRKARTFAIFRYP